MPKQCTPYEIIDECSQPNGRSRILIECPYCQKRVWGFLWSLAGSGKKCPGCGAKHTLRIGTMREVEAE